MRYERANNKQFPSPGTSRVPLGTLSSDNGVVYGSPEGHSDTGLQFQPVSGPVSDPVSCGIGPGLVRYRLAIDIYYR